jgi:histidinol-phosphate phosphatase family protein
VKAVILAGGKGSRLAARANGLPKPLVPVDGKPLLAYQLELLARHGVKQVTLLCGYGAEQIEAFCGDGTPWGLKLRCIKERQALGTAGAVIAALSELPEEFFVLYGDTMLNVDLARMNCAHAAGGAAATLFLHPNEHPQDSDLVECDEQGRITAIHGYPHLEGALLPNQVNAALYVLRREALGGYAVPEQPLDFAKHVFPRMLREGVHLHGYRSPEYIKDAGTPERLDGVEADVRSGVVERGSLAVRRPAVFLDRDGTINEEASYITRPEQLKLLPGAAAAVRAMREAGYRIVVVTNQPVVARGDCSTADLLRIHDHMEMELSREGAFLDGIYYCPHHPDKGFAGERAELKMECECRKPRDGMIRRAARELNLDLAASWLIGDRTGDIQAARNCGIRSILLRTGMGGRDQRYAAAPDSILDDLPAAARFIAGQGAAGGR